MYNGVPHAVMSMLHRTQGRQAGFVQTVLRNLSNNSSTAVKFRSTDSVEFCHKIGLNYVSCSPFRVPIARLAAAQAAINNK